MLQCRSAAGHLVAATQDMTSMGAWPHSVEEAERFIDEHKQFVERVFAEHALVELEKDSERVMNMLDVYDSSTRNRYVLIPAMLPTNTIRAIQVLKKLINPIAIKKNCLISS